ncbi:hypothetical protein DRW03_20300 [Corallococcus sp. H22C18031201]|nr:hypothetical protein DRW03_20300 [Corallococcus sp. H22C18031201]
MTQRLIAAAPLLLLAGCGFEQPNSGCIVQDSASWILKYDEVQKATDDVCVANKRFAPVGELAGIFKYIDLEKGGDSTLAIRPDGLASRGARDNVTNQREQTAFGNLNLQQDAQYFCSADDLSVAKVDAVAREAVPGKDGKPGISAEEPKKLAYVFTHVKVYSAPSAPGTQFSADLEYTDNGCTSTYKVRGMWPAVACTPGSEVPALSCGQGSGVNPDFAVVCDPTLKLCVPEKGIPSLK